MGAWQEIADYIVPSNTTSVVLDSFGTITKDDFVKVVVTHTNPTGNFDSLAIYPNGQTTGYTTQYLGTTGTSGNEVFATRAGNNVVLRQGINGSTATAVAYIKLSENDRYNHFSNHTSENSSNVRVEFLYTTSSGVTFSSGITSLTFAAAVTNAIGTGSRIQIYKLAAEKVRDIIVETNSTQVNIPTTGIFDPAIDKDSEYLLVSDIDQVASGDILINPNDLNTNTAYYTAASKGVGGTASSALLNQPRFIDGGNGLKHLNHTHIKLSNINVYTAQSFGIKNYGTGSLEIFNPFISSTAENITSITKLNIRATTANAIGAGSRFTLYKLYE